MRQMTLLKFGITAVLIFLLISNAFGANQYKTRQNPFTGKPDYILGTDNLEVTNLTASGTVTGQVVSATTALQVGSDYIIDITGSGLSIVGGVLTAGGSESTTVSDTTTINLTLTGSDITADGLYTAGDGISLTTADFDIDYNTTNLKITANQINTIQDIATTASPTFTNVTASNTATGVVVDTQYFEYSTGASLTIRDNLIVNGTLTATNLSGTNTGDNTVATTGDSATSFFSSGTLEVAIGGTGTTTSTGTGAVVLGTSPALTTPNLGAVATGSTWSLADTITTLSIYTGTTSLEETTGATDSGGYIVGLFDEFAFSAGTDVQTVIDDLDAAIPDYYQYTLLPESATLDDGAPPAITVIESTGTNTPRFRVADFDPTTDEIIYWTFIVPDDMAAGNWLADVSWYSNDLGANETCVWGIAISATSEADVDTMAEQAAPTIDYASEDVNTTEVNRLIQTTITISDLDSVAAGDVVTLQFRRDADSTGGTDDLSSDSRLVAVRLRIPRT